MRRVQVVATFVATRFINVPQHLNPDAAEGSPEYDKFRQWLIRAADKVSVEEARFDSICVIDESQDILYEG